jgi:predicted nucleotidyltransferase
VFEALKQVLADDPCVAYALVFGSAARGTGHVHSDVDVAVGIRGRRRLGALEIGALVSKLESAAGRPVDLVLLDEAPPGLAYRVFRDGRVLVEHDRPALLERKTRAILEYLDFQPVEEQLARGALAAAARHGR